MKELNIINNKYELQRCSLEEDFNTPNSLKNHFINHVCQTSRNKEDFVDKVIAQEYKDIKFPHYNKVDTEDKYKKAAEEAANLSESNVYLWLDENHESNHNPKETCVTKLITPSRILTDNIINSLNKKFNVDLDVSLLKDVVIYHFKNGKLIPISYYLTTRTPYISDYTEDTLFNVVCNTFINNIKTNSSLYNLNSSNKKFLLLNSKRQDENYLNVNLPKGFYLKEIRVVDSNGNEFEDELYKHTVKEPKKYLNSFKIDKDGIKFYINTSDIILTEKKINIVYYNVYLTTNNTLIRNRGEGTLHIYDRISRNDLRLNKKTKGYLNTNNSRISMYICPDKGFKVEKILVDGEELIINSNDNYTVSKLSDNGLVIDNWTPYKIKTIEVYYKSLKK